MRMETSADEPQPPYAKRRAQSVTKITVSSPLLRLFHRNRSREQDVVLQVNVLVQISFKFK